jgi:hypothetical protein
MVKPQQSDFYLYSWVIEHNAYKRLDKGQKIRVNKVKKWIKYKKRVGDAK